jgi:hypothetical protein
MLYINYAILSYTWLKDAGIPGVTYGKCLTLYIDLFCGAVNPLADNWSWTEVPRFEIKNASLETEGL